jgi:hypothetical protein
MTDHETAMIAARVRMVMDRRMDRHKKAQMVADALVEAWGAARCVISLEYPNGSSINFKGERGNDNADNAELIAAEAINRAPPVGAGESGEEVEKRPMAANDRDGPIRVPDSGVD